MTEITSEMEDEIELAYWRYDDFISKGNFGERDCYKMSVRNMLRKILEMERNKP